MPVRWLSAAFSNVSQWLFYSPATNSTVYVIKPGSAWSFCVSWMMVFLQCSIKGDTVSLLHEAALWKHVDWSWLVFINSSAKSQQKLSNSLFRAGLHRSNIIPWRNPQRQRCQSGPALSNLWDNIFCVWIPFKLNWHDFNCLMQVQAYQSFHSPAPRNCYKTQSFLAWPRVGYTNWFMNYRLECSNSIERPTLKHSLASSWLQCYLTHVM